MARRILVIGASSAIAAEVARLYAAAGDRLYLIARSEDRLRALVDEIEPAVLGFACADLDELDQAQARVDAAIEALGELDVALICHGVLGDQLRSERELDVALQSIRTNFTSALALLIPLANYFEARGAGHLGVITSVAGDRGRPRNYTYGAAKGGLSRYLEGVRSRLRPRGVWVHDLRLGPVDTPMTRDHPKNLLFAQPRPVARAIVRALGRRRGVVYVPGYWRLIMLIVRNLPEVVFQRLGFLAGR